MIQLAISLTQERGGIVTALDPTLRQWGAQDCMNHLLIVEVEVSMETAQSWCGPKGHIKNPGTEEQTWVTELTYSHGINIDAIGIDIDAIRASEEWIIPTITADQVVAR